MWFGIERWSRMTVRNSNKITLYDLAPSLLSYFESEFLSLDGIVPMREGLIAHIQDLIDTGVIDVRERAYTPSNNLLMTVLDSEMTGSAKSTQPLYLAKWVPKRSGSVIVKGSFYGATTVDLVGVTDVDFIEKSDNKGNNNFIEFKDTLLALANSTPGALVTGFSNMRVSCPHVETTSTSAYTTGSCVLKVTNGVPVYFVLAPSSTTSYRVYCNKIEIYADEV